MGDVVSILLGELVMNIIGWDWSVFILIFIFLLFLSGLSLHLFVEECPMERDHRNLTTCQKLHEQLNNLQQNFIHLNRFGAILEHAFLTTYYYNLLLWFPFYFTFIHHGQYASYLSIISPICLVIGNAFFQNLIKLCPSFTHWVSCLFYLMVVVIHWVLLEINKADEAGSISLYFILIVAASFIVGGPYSEITLNEFKGEADGDGDALYCMYSMMNLLKSTISLFLSYLIGSSMESGKLVVM